MRKTISILFALALVLSFSLVATTPVAASTIWYVTDGGAGAEDGTSWATAFATIQEAVTAASGGHTIMVGAGTYVQTAEILIDKDLTMIGAGKTDSIIERGAAFSGSYFFRVDAGGFNLSKVTLDGKEDLYGGVRYATGGTLDGNIIKNMVAGTYLGFGVVVYGDNVTVSSNTFTNIGRVGIWVGADNAVVTGNIYTGKGDIDGLDYGIEVGYGGVATITGNTITNCKALASSDGSTSAGILVTDHYGTGTEALITGNTVTDNRYGIIVGYGAADQSLVVANFNNIFNNTVRGIRNTAIVSMDGTHNWWGHASGPSGEGLGSGDSVSTNVDFNPWLVEKDGAETTATNTDFDVDASASTAAVSAAATGGAGDTTVTVGEYLGNPSSVDSGFAGGALFFDVHVGGTLPGLLVVEMDCPGGDCAGIFIKWFDGSSWKYVVPQQRVGGVVRATLSESSSPKISQLTGTYFTLGDPVVAYALPSTVVGWEGSPVSKAAVMIPIIGLLAAIAGVGMLVWRRRRAEG